MRSILLIGFTLVISCGTSPAIPKLEPQRYYHDAVGFELAGRIKTDEEAMMEKLAKNANRAEPLQDYDVNRIIGGGGLVISFVNVAGQSVCGSTLLSPNRLVTAAHCWFDGNNQASQFEVVLGSQFLFFGGTRIVTRNVITHPGWIFWPLINDIAMIYLPTNVFYSQSIQPAALPSVSQLQDSFAGQWAIAVGYGRTSDQQIGVSISTERNHVSLLVITVQQCQGVFGSSHVIHSTLCTSGVGFVGICGGDSGGPLVVNQNGQTVLVGISSFVNQNGCQLGTPSAFARVTSFYNFIQQHLW